MYTKTQPNAIRFPKKTVLVSRQTTVRRWSGATLQEKISPVYDWPDRHSPRCYGLEMVIVVPSLSGSGSVLAVWL
jgi:hypothetical protein